MPKLVYARLERIQREILWGGSRHEKKPHLVKWSTVCTKEQGLGLRSFSKLNKALLVSGVGSLQMRGIPSRER